MDIVAYDTATGKRSVLISAAQLTPQRSQARLSPSRTIPGPRSEKAAGLHQFEEVWRQNTRGDYWVFDEAAGKLTKLGGRCPRVHADVCHLLAGQHPCRLCPCHNNLYVEDLASGKDHPAHPRWLRGHHQRHFRLGFRRRTGLRNCFRWSPDGQSIAYWQFDQSGVGEYTLINDTEAEYPVTTKYKYPQPGTTNSAVRAGVVSVCRRPHALDQTRGRSAPALHCPDGVGGKLQPGPG